MILVPPDAKRNFFLIGHRARLPGKVGPDGKGEKIGALVVRSMLGLDGAALDGGEVGKEDAPYPGGAAEGPFRYESEIAPFKPAPDVIVVGVAADDGTPYGTVAVDRGAGFGVPVARLFGWASRLAAPRLGLAGREGTLGDPVSLAGFKADQFDLPDQFDNGFLNGGPLVGETPFATGDRLRFTPISGTAHVLTVPPAPSAIAKQDGAAIVPPPVPAARVDTVVLDLVAQTFTLVWRAVFPWEARFETAKLEIA
jgi:hypothetical protein